MKALGNASPLAARLSLRSRDMKNFRKKQVRKRKRLNYLLHAPMRERSWNRQEMVDLIYRFGGHSKIVTV